VAASRVRDPFEPRGKDDQTSFRQIARILKQSRIILESPLKSDYRAPIMPRITAKRPRYGYAHPAGKTDILRILEFFGERYFYGLRSIELIQGSGVHSETPLVFG
jgi:hypothetical protein